MKKARQNLQERNKPDDLIERYDEGYVSYTERMNDYYVSVFNSYEYCESCEVDESD